MTIIQSIILGIVQGLTEFLPISSSAHLVLVPYLLNWNIPESQVFPFDVLVQLGTLAAVIIYFWSDLWTIIKAFFRGLIQRKPFADQQSRMGWYLILASVPAAFSGMLLKSKVEAAFNSAMVTTLFLILTAVMLILAEVFGKRKRSFSQINWLDALWMGIFQALSIFPGVSRSGSSITGGMTRQLDRPSAARFSFLMSIPVMLGAGLVSVKDLLEVPNLSSFLPVMAIGFIVAGIVGYLSIHWLLSFLGKRSLFYFAVYCILLAALVLGVNALREPAAPRASIQPTETGQTVASQKNAAVINLEYSSSLAWMEPAFSSCADTLKTAGLVTHALPTSQFDLTQSDVILHLGAPETLALPSVQLGEERIALTVNFNNPLKALTPNLARKVFSGEITRWSDLAAACPECFAGDLASSVGDQPILLNFYAADEDLQQIFDNGLMTSQAPARSQALLIPDTAAMAETLTNKVNAIGILPAHMIKDNLKEVSLADFDNAVFEKPILAITNTSPDGALRTWLGCLQQVLNP